MKVDYLIKRTINTENRFDSFLPIELITLSASFNFYFSNVETLKHNELYLNKQIYNIHYALA